MIVCRKYIVFIGVLVIILFGLFLFRKNIISYYQFSSYCGYDFGFHVYEKVEVDSVWRANDYFNAALVAQFEQVKSARYKKSNGDVFEVKYVEGDKKNIMSYSNLLSGSLEESEYEQVSESEFIGKYKEIKKIKFKFIRLNDGFLMSEYIDYKTDFIGDDSVSYYCNSDIGYFYKNIYKIF
ncbi:hypothetical protein [Aliamphritea hakodatensis]|uniref:hypothetical protein n=1 Tax=Aliamphritea hakodatensis TaxID=2895352 RepID=UPI0022FD4FC2|nr:hypothetical protein [Aliamphritea hakodatensis]